MYFRIALASFALATTAGTAQGQDTTLRWFTIFDASQQELWAPVVEAYEEQHPDVDIEMETVAGSGAAVYPDVLRTSIASGDPADVFFMWGGSIAQPFIDSGQVRELSDFYAQYGWEDRFAPWLMERLSTDDGIFGVPFHARGMGLFYRTDIFADLGLTVPTSYEELEQICEAVTAEGIYCASFGGKFGWQTMRLVDYFLEDTCGAEVHDAINAREQSWDQPCVVDAFDRLSKWVSNEWLVPDFLNVAPNDARMPLYLGNAAMMYEGPWLEQAIKANEQDVANYGFFLPPTPSGRYHAFPEQWMIPLDAKLPEAAAAFLDWLTDPAVQNQFPEVFGGSATIGFEMDCEIAPLECGWMEYLSSDRGTYPPTDQAFPKELIDGFFEAQDAVVAGRMTGAEAAALIQQRVEQFEN